MGAQVARAVRPYTCSLMIRWLIVIFLALLLVNGLHGWLQRIGLGRLPGDFRFRLFGMGMQPASPPGRTEYC